MLRIRAVQSQTFKPHLYQKLLFKDIQNLKQSEDFTNFDLKQMMRNGELNEQKESLLFLYEQRWKGFASLGVMLELNVEDYQQNKIKKHEQTLEKENYDAKSYACNHVGPVAVAYNHVQEIDRDLIGFMQNQVFAEWQTIDGRKHRLWKISNFDGVIKKLQRISCMYIMDGHHRFKAALQNLTESGQILNENDKWIQAVVYSTKYIRAYPQYRRLIHRKSSLVMNKVLACKKLKLERIKSFDRNHDEFDIVLLYKGLFYKLNFVHINQGQDSIQILDHMLQEFLKEIGDRFIGDGVEFVPSIIFDFQKAQQIKETIFFIRHQTVEHIISTADEGKFLSAKSTWLEPKPCLHMVIRFPY